jgi:hypothetical protein
MVEWMNDGMIERWKECTEKQMMECMDEWLDGSECIFLIINSLIN